MKILNKIIDTFLIIFTLSAVITMLTLCIIGLTLTGNWKELRYVFGKEE